MTPWCAAAPATAGHDIGRSWAGHTQCRKGDDTVVSTQEVSATINGTTRTAEVEPAHPSRSLLAGCVWGLTGTHIGCDTSQCGACVVLLDGKTVKSCTVFAVQAEGAEITTIEGPGSDGSPRMVACTPCRKGSGSSMVCNAASVRPA